MSKTPNQEQIKGITHQGGVLLSAGAGSGKTFVLVEHIIYLVKCFIEKENTQGLLDFSKKIKKYFSQIILITYTKKAAGEIRIRVQDRIQKEALESKEKETWMVVLNAADYLHISTIHAFFKKVLAQEYFPNFGRHVDIMTDIEYNDRIKRLLNEWFLIKKKESLSSTAKDIYNILVMEQISFKKSLEHIFSSPELRKEWKYFNPEQIKKIDLGSILNEYFLETNIRNIFSPPSSLSVMAESKSTAWHKFIQDLQDVIKQHPLKNIEDLASVKNFFESSKRIPGVPKKHKSTDVLEYHQRIRDLKNFLESHYDDLKAFEENRESLFIWVAFVRSAFCYIEEHYRENSRMTFSDLEYYVHEGLGLSGVIDRMAQSYRYIIIDEFQDTSPIQFKIITKMIKENYQRLFCVGDKKQAIYGFRGGSLDVFNRCEKKVKNNLNMVCNFRSAKEIVKFNNNFFERLFKLGPGFRGEDIHSTVMAAQKAGTDVRGGIVKQVSIDIKADHHLGNPDTNKIELLEAKGIFNLIGEMREKKEYSEVAVLYKILGPSKILLGYLLNHKIPFTAQIKVPRKEDPIVGLCLALLEVLLNVETSEKKDPTTYIHFMVSSYFSFLGIMIPENLKEQIEYFFESVKIYGFEQSFWKFIYDLGVVNSNHENNMNFIQSLGEVIGEDLNKSRLVLKSLSNNEYTIDFNRGREDQKCKVIIMTVHSSKGLEFENVILGGIHTNGRAKPFKDPFGKIPASLKWKSKVGQRKFFKSPNYILESHISSQKDFSESKRLFYVACTRAKKGLFWINLSFNGKELSYAKNSWIVGLRKLKEIDFKNETREESIFNESSTIKRYKKSPLFHLDNMGLIERKGQKRLLFLSEISVTNLATITQCPRKFYLQNVCRFEESLDFGMDKKRKILGKFERNENVGAVSSMERGSRLHEKISEMITQKWAIPSEVSDQKDREILSWVKESLETFRSKNGQFFSEKPIKFSLFGQIVSGIVDLAMVYQNQQATSLEVWDFKTGSSREKEDFYWFQLFCYAYAFSTRYSFSEKQSITVAISYVDRREIIKKETNRKAIIDKMKLEWEKLDKFNQVNKNHCVFCSYQNLCEMSGQ